MSQRVRVKRINNPKYVLDCRSYHGFVVLKTRGTNEQIIAEMLCILEAVVENVSDGNKEVEEKILQMIKEFPQAHEEVKKRREA